MVSGVAGAANLGGRGRVQVHWPTHGPVHPTTNGPHHMNTKTRDPFDERATKTCPHCTDDFQPRRSDQKFCCRKCARAATRNTSRGPRQRENARRTKLHYVRAAWLCYDLQRMNWADRRAMMFQILEAASGPDAALRNILLDPALLRADWGSPIGKLYPDTGYMDVKNVAKLVNEFCKAEWGIGVRDMILHGGRPAFRSFKAERAAIVPPHIYGEQPEPPLRDYVAIDPSTFFAELAALRAYQKERSAE